VVDGDYNHEGRDDGDDAIDDLIASLQNPGCGVETLELRSLRIGSSDVTSTMQVNRNLNGLLLYHINLFNNKSVSQLWHLVGLKELFVDLPDFHAPSIDDPDCWAELVRRNPNLLKLSVIDSDWIDCANRLVTGACGHESLESMELLHG
jgi:hypothetical protein